MDGLKLGALGEGWIVGLVGVGSLLGVRVGPREGVRVGSSALGDFEGRVVGMKFGF